jgi:hypothetical protein
MSSFDSDISAIDDLKIDLDYHADWPPGRAIFLHNTNRNRAIRASIEIEADRTFEVRNLERAFPQTLFPQSFEVSVPPGLRQYLGKNIFQKFEKEEPGQQVEFLEIHVRTVVRGARYADELLPRPDLETIKDYLKTYGIESTQGRKHYVINTNRLWGIQAQIHEGDGPQTNLRLKQMRQMRISVGKPDPKWSLIDGRFVENNQPAPEAEDTHTDPD